MDLISPAYAQTAISSSGGDLIASLVPIFLILLIMYFLILRPQQRRARDHQELIKNVRRGDTIVTSGGLVGRVARVIDEKELDLEIAPDVRVRVLRHMIYEVRAKGEPVKDKG